MSISMSSWLICVISGCSRIPPFPHPRADAAATEHGVANPCLPMAATVVWACPLPVLQRVRSAEGRASRRAPDLHQTTVSR